MTNTSFIDSYRLFTQTDRSTFSKAQVAATMALGLALGQAAELAHNVIPKDNEYVFYALEFVLNVALPYATIAVSPYMVKACSWFVKVKSC